MDISKEIVNRVLTVANPIVADTGMELIDIEYHRESKGWVLRLTLDKPGGITLEDCSTISQEVGRVLDIEDFIPNPYTLEVSSPGLNRPLKTERDFIKYCSHWIRLKTIDPIRKRRHFKGRLLKVSESQIEIEVEGEIFEIPLSNVAKAHLELDQDDLWKGKSSKTA